MICVRAARFISFHLTRGIRYPIGIDRGRLPRVYKKCNKMDKSGKGFAWRLGFMPFCSLAVGILITHFTRGLTLHIRFFVNVVENGKSMMLSCRHSVLFVRLYLGSVWRVARHIINPSRRNVIVPFYCPDTESAYLLHGFYF
jgi:hypothetical protein